MVAREWVYQMMQFTTTVEQYADTQDYYIQIPHYVLQKLNWKEGDTLNWQITDSKQIIITKIKNAEESGGEDQESNISEATQEDWEDFWYNSESEGKDYDQRYDEWISARDAYIQATNEETYGVNPETFGQAYHSPEQQGSWS